MDHTERDGWKVCENRTGSVLPVSYTHLLLFLQLCTRYILTNATGLEISLRYYGISLKFFIARGEKINLRDPLRSFATSAM